MTLYRKSWWRRNWDMSEKAKWVIVAVLIGGCFAALTMWLGWVS